MIAAPPSTFVVVPAYQALRTLPEVLRGVEEWGLPVLVVDDGSTDGSHRWLTAWQQERPAGRSLLTMPRNGGKALALQAAFRALSDRGVAHVVTLDADGQHHPSDGPALLASAAAAPGRRVVCGRRSLATEGYPRRRMTGRVLNDLAIRAQTGVAVEDSPCGFRVYPMEALRAVRCRSGRFAWEEEFLTRAAWAGFELDSVPIRCIYRRSEPGAPASHYRFARDWPEGVAVNLWLLLRALGPVWRRPALGRQLRRWLAPGAARSAWRGPAPARLHGAAAIVLGFAAGVAAGVVPAALGPEQATFAGGVRAAVGVAWAWASLRWHASAWLAAVGFGAGWLAVLGLAAVLRLTAAG